MVESAGRKRGRPRRGTAISSRTAPSWISSSVDDPSDPVEREQPAPTSAGHRPGPATRLRAAGDGTMGELLHEALRHLRHDLAGDPVPCSTRLRPNREVDVRAPATTSRTLERHPSRKPPADRFEPARRFRRRRGSPSGRARKTDQHDCSRLRSLAGAGPGARDAEERQRPGRDRDVIGGHPERGRPDAAPRCTSQLGPVFRSMPPAIGSGLVPNTPVNPLASRSGACPRCRPPRC